MRVWMISFELQGVASLGGLGEAVKARVKALSSRGHDVTVLMPSHGRCDRRALFEECGERIGIDGRSYGYCVRACERSAWGARIVMFAGGPLDLPHIYEWVEEKASLLAIGARSFAHREPWPDILEVHDWHSVLAGVAIKQMGEERRYAIPMLYTIHLSGSPSFPWHYAEWSGLRDMRHPVWRRHRHEHESYRSVWDSVGGNVELFGAIEADQIATVSWSYLREELARRHGEAILGKSCVIYNATDAIPPERPERPLDLLWDVQRFGEITGGQLFVALGRLTAQKGLDIAIRALDHAPGASLLILGIPVGDHGYEEYLRRLASERWGRVMITFGKLDERTRLSIIASAVATVVPSRWEPFGIVAVESLAAGTPVIAAAVGGLKEIVSDIRAGGTGLLVPPENPEELGWAMREMMALVSREGERIRGRCREEAERRFRESSVYGMIMDCYERARRMAYYRAMTL